MTTEQKVIRSTRGLLELAKPLGNVRQACQVMGMSRDTFSRYKERDQIGGAEAEREISRRKAKLRNRVAPEVDQRVVALAGEQPPVGASAIGQ